MAETLRGLRDGILHPIPQDHSKASTARLLKKEDGRINWNLPAQTTFNRMRAFTPWPGVYTSFRGASCHLLFSSTATLASPEERRLCPEPAAPGTILYDGRELLVSCGEETLLLVSRVKVEGRKEVSALEFANGTHLQSGEHFR